MNVPNILKWILVAVFSMQDVSTARILGIYTVLSHSHSLWNNKLMQGLAARGHNVTVLSPDPERTPVANLRTIVIEDYYGNIWNDEVMAWELLTEELPWYRLGSLMNTYSSLVCPLLIRSNGMKALMKEFANENKPFDLILIDGTMCECFLGLIPMFGHPPFILISPFMSPTWLNRAVGNLENPSYVPSIWLKYTQYMSFSERLINTFVELHTLYYSQFVEMPHMNQLAREVFGESLPPIEDIMLNLSLAIVNHHFSINEPKPVVPGLIQVGALHAGPPKPLPQDLKRLLDSSQNGVIFFSLGSNLKSAILPGHIRIMFQEAFAQLPQVVLWKWEDDSLPGQPPNVKLGKWFPQNDILAHPNLKLFISHCGLLSTQESMYHGVPILGVPVFFDQVINADKIVQKGAGIKLNFKTISKKKIVDAINKIINSASYGEKMKDISKVLRDNPQTPLERAIYWIEYVLRHNGAKHLRSAALELSWYQYMLLDVAAVFLATLVIIIYLTYTVTKLVIVSIRRKPTPVAKKRE